MHARLIPISIGIPSNAADAAGHAIGPAVGKRIYRGPTVHGTDEAIGRELQEAFDTMDGQEGQEMRDRVSKVREKFEEDLKEGGRTWEALRTIGNL